MNQHVREVLRDNWCSNILSMIEGNIEQATLFKIVKN